MYCRYHGTTPSSPATATPTSATVAEEQGEWFRIILHGRSNVWIKSRNRVRAMVEPVSGDAGAVWIKQEARYAAIMAGEDPDELDKEEEPPAPPAAPAAAAATPAAATPAAAAPAAAGGGGSGGGGGAEVVSYYIAKNNCRSATHRNSPQT